MSSVLSSLAYLFVCLLIACHSRDRPWASLSVPGLINLASFLFIPCGRLPALCSFPGSALAALALLTVTGFHGRYRPIAAPLGLASSLAMMARYAQQRGLPGDLYTLDAYVSMPLAGIAEGVATPGVWILAAASLLALRIESPMPGKKAHEALSAEIRRLALTSFWVCLFFPFSFTHDPISRTGALAFDALFFWAKVLSLKWLLGRQNENNSGRAMDCANTKH
jgi:hypothetical protein